MMKRAVLSFAFVLSVQLGVPGFAKADNSENMNLSIEGDMNMGNGEGPFWGEGGHGGGHGGGGHHGGGGCHGGGGHRDGYWGGGGGWDGGRGGYGSSSWTCMAENSYRSVYYGTGYNQYDAQREALRSCNRASFFSSCYVTRCY